MNEEKQLSEAEHLIAMKNSKGWEILMFRYERIIKDISDLRTIPRTTLKNNVEVELTSEERMKEMITREGALSLFSELFESISADVDKFYEVMAGDMEEKQKDNIVRFDN